MKYLVDANILSELTKPDPSSSVIAWLRLHETQIVVNPIVLGEIEFGILLLPKGKRRSRLEEWFSGVVQKIRVLDFDAATASAWAALLARLRKNGVAVPIKDSLIAATAIAHQLTIVTRNTGDFLSAKVPLENPFLN